MSANKRKPKSFLPSPIEQQQVTIKLGTVTFVPSPNNFENLETVDSEEAFKDLRKAIVTGVFKNAGTDDINKT
jgi:hypothetical protein